MRVNYPGTGCLGVRIACKRSLRVLNTRLPVARLTRVMRERKDSDAVGIGPIYDSERKIFEKNSQRVFGRARTSERKGKGASRCLLDCCSESYTEPRPLLVVVDDFGQKLTSRCCNESGALHRDRRRASAKTSSAA